MKKLKLPVLAFLLAMTAALAIHAKSKTMIDYTWYKKGPGPSGAYTLISPPSPNPPTQCPYNSPGSYICAKGFSTITPPAVVTDLTVANMEVYQLYP